MALIFPASPSLDQVYQQDGAVYEWTGSKWRRIDTFENAIVVEYSDIVEQTSNTALIEPDKYSYFKITVDDNTTITVPSASTYSNLIIELTLGTTAYTITWSDNVEWAGGSAPSYNYGYAAKVLLEFTTYDGTNWIGSELLDYTIPVIVPTGQQEYTDPGTYTWVAPEGVTTVYAVAIGGGGAGGYAIGFPGNRTPRSPGGGAGGGLGWKNSISVTPGQSYTVVVGAGGTGSGADGANSYFISTDTVAGLGGQGGHNGWNNTYSGSARIATGGSFVGDGGGTGGTGAPGGGNWSTTTSADSGGAGGAAGYSGNGGAGGTNGTGTSGSGGGGGGAGAPTGNTIGFSGNGGGVGIYGEGTSGAGGTNGTGYSGKSGSGAANPAYDQGTTGGVFGGGGGAAAVSNSNTVGGNNGGKGAVRIIWGSDRAFPSTNTGDL